MQKVKSHFHLEEILSEIEFEFSDIKIDRSLVISKVKSELAYFGELMCIPKYDIVHIKEGLAELPSDFKSFMYGFKLEPQKMYCSEDIEVVQRYYNMKDYFYELPYEKNGHCKNDKSFCQDTCDCDTTMLHHIEYECENVKVSVGYKANYPLKLSRHSIQRGLLSKMGKSYNNSPYEVNIYNKIIHTNFDEGAIFIKYYAFLEDEDGIPMIPEGFNENVRRFITLLIKKYLCESYKTATQEGMKQYVGMFYNSIVGEYRAARETVKAEFTKPTSDEIVERLMRNRLHMNKYSKPFKYI